MRNRIETPSLGNDDADRVALAILAGFLAARIVFAFALGPGIDESYTIAIARRLSLSYFDHPPLHQWIAHFAALALGEGFAARAPFIALFAATGWIFYRLTLGLFGARAAIIALFSLNVAPFFFASAGSWVVPDGPLLFGLAVAAWALAQLFFDAPPSYGRIWGLWLIVGLGLGLAGLSKYSAIVSVAGLAAFVALAPRQRHWLKHPAPYCAAAVALVIVAPVFVWNARHGWVSFAFQGSRGVPSGSLRPAQFMQNALGQVAYLWPWLFAVAVAGLAAASRRRGDERRLFLLCLALPPIVLFSLTPLWGGRGQPHWTMPGWFFAFALMGAWLDETAIADRTLRRLAVASAGLLAALAAIVVLQASTGMNLRLARPGLPDPTLEAFSWRGLRDAPALKSAPAFVISTKWSDAGKIALALGPGIPVFVISGDPRGWAFVDDGARFLGRDGVVITRATDIGDARRLAPSVFTSLGESRNLSLTRHGYPVVELALIPAQGLTRTLPIPYPGAPGR